MAALLKIEHFLSQSSASWWPGTVSFLMYFSASCSNLMLLLKTKCQKCCNHGRLFFFFFFLCSRVKELKRAREHETPQKSPLSMWHPPPDSDFVFVRTRDILQEKLGWDGNANTYLRQCYGFNWYHMYNSIFHTSSSTDLDGERWLYGTLNDKG